MPKVAILMPQLGESIAEATIMQVLVKPGDTVQADQEVFEVETNKAVMGVTTVCGGTILSLDVRAGETVPVGAIMGIIEATEEEIERSGATPLDATAPAPAAAPATEKSSAQDGAHFRTEGEFREGMPGGGRRRPLGEGGRGLPVPMGQRGSRFLSPRIRAGFAASVEWLGDFARDVLVFAVMASPVAAIGAAVWLLWKLMKKIKNGRNPQ